MTVTEIGRSARIRQELDHPVIDADGHFVEYMPLMLDIMREVADQSVADHFARRFPRWYALSPDERQERRYTRPPWWALPTANTIDSATSVLPKLLTERMGDIGLDYAILYPTNGLTVHHLAEDELRQAACRAWNTYQAEVFGPHADRLTGVGIIPMHSPAEALAEIEHSVVGLGHKAVLMPSHVSRSFGTGSRKGTYLDVFALDSDFDYDPVWARCAELGLSPTFHSGGMGWGSRMSPSTYMYNHIGHFAAASEALCKALFFGGVTHRFPSMKFGFLEGGVGWGVDVFAAIVARWEKRGGGSVANYDPENFDQVMFRDLFATHAEGRMSERADQVDDVFHRLGPEQERDQLDDFAAAHIDKAEDIVDRFIPNFYFGCEADDPMNAWAFNTKGNPFGAKVRAMFSSDIGHWDVPDMLEVLEEAYELVEHDLLSVSDFREFVFTNVAQFYGTPNPDFFKNTVVEAEVATVTSG